IDFLEGIVRQEKLEGYFLIPAADTDVKFAAQAHARLSKHLTLLLPDWSSLQWAADKVRTYQRAAELGLAVPEIYPVRSEADAACLPMRVPVALKPAMRLASNRFTRAKVWRADDRDSVVRLYADAASLVA